MPGQRVRGFPKIRSYPVVERYGFIWVWPGDAALADPAKIHHLEWAENPEWAYGGGLYHINCDYRLMIDNLMDLTHETYVHTTSIGQKEIDETPVTTKTEGEHGRHQPLHGQHDGAAVLARQPARQQPGRRRAGGPLAGLPLHAAQPRDDRGGRGARRQGRLRRRSRRTRCRSIVVDFLTPETETSMWYFWGMARNFNPKDKALTAQIREGQAKVFAEDTADAGSAAAQPAAPPGAQAADAQHRRRRRAVAPHHRPADGARNSRAASCAARDGARHRKSQRRCARRARPRTSRSFELAAPTARPLPAFSAGSHIDVQLPGGLTRQYSLCNDAERAAPLPHRRAARPGLARRLGRHARRGERGRRARRSASRATTSRWCTRSARLLFAGGIGVTPLLCMAQRLAAIGADFDAALLHALAANAPPSASEIAASAFAARVHFHFDDGAAAQKLDLAGAAGDAGRRHAPVRLRARRASSTTWSDTREGAGLAGGADPPRILRRRAAGHTGDRRLRGEASPAAARSVRSPPTRPWCRRCRRTGVEILTSCEQGVCGTCITRVLEGERDHRDLYFTDEEKAKNDQFTPCCSRAKSRVLVLDL